MKEKEELSRELLEVLCCPDDKGELEYNKEKQVLKCVVCGEEYPIKHGIPVLLPKG